ncbi:60 kDa lysophospholipase isoform X1 [Tachyglossus aculeatus]|uniref:60 kDa lysophospholipase isoform X1 n=2 Tax=Tachyglossus aculeatus TaxID=9261 RepID=UPI0018F69EDE|nr:60 kDa lysophospholipase isoform X1 [Tachyglossus aculeatus]
MRSSGGVLVPGQNLVAALRKLPMFHDEEFSRSHNLPADTLALPLTSQNKRIVYTVLECQPLFDSSDMTIKEWTKIAKDIEANYDTYHGFVVIHGTDTMAFATSMLSFMLGNLQKTVILTGAQVPIHALWNDGRENLLGSLLMAGQFIIPEVCLFFQNQLFRGNRVTKVDSRKFAAFCSPNLPPLALIGADITINCELMMRPNPKKRLLVHTNMERNVGVLRLYPGITAAMVKGFLQPPMRGMVMETFGTGNGPTARDLLQELKDATERGMIIINCTHCLQGHVTSDYAAGLAIAGTGIISGSDMTSEAALAKLSYVLGHTDLSLEGKKKLLRKNLRGEMTPLPEDYRVSLRDSKFVQVVAKYLGLSSSRELDAVRDALTPSLACAAARTGDLEALDAILDMGTDLSQGDFDGRTPLHVAAREGHLGAVQRLLCHGARVGATDRDGASPLLAAVKGRHLDVIDVLRAAGAELSPKELQGVGTELCRLAASGDIDGLIVWRQAGADWAEVGYTGQSPLQVAEAAGNQEVVNVLRTLGDRGQHSGGQSCGGGSHA